jgi:hypothetical protein
MRCLGVVVRGVEIGPHEHRHAQLAAPGDKFSKDIAIAQPGTAVMKRDRGGIVGDAASAAETHTVGARALEVVEPERGVEMSWIVLNESKLRPSHGSGRPCGSLLGIPGGNDLTPQAGRDVSKCGTGAGHRR